MHRENSIISKEVKQREYLLTCWYNLPIKLSEVNNREKIGTLNPGPQDTSLSLSI